MKVRRNKQNINKSSAKRGKRYISDVNQYSYITDIDLLYNDPQKFSWADFNRQTVSHDLIRNYYDNMIRMNGVDLAYFRKYNTFFKEGKENHANIIYGEDTTAEYYISADVRAFLNISKQDFTFNMMGYEAMEEIEIFISIEDFRARFTSLIGTVSSEVFYVPVHGDLLTNEYFGVIDVPEFYAEFYGTLPNNDRFLTNVYPETKERATNSQFFKSLARVSNLYPLTGTLEGWLYPEEERGYKLSGYLSGELSYHTFNNIENSPGWNIAPQVGDFFKLKAGEIEEEYEINQIIDRQLTNQGGINPLLGKYIFICKAVRRNSSHEEINPQNVNKDINDELINQLINKIENNEVELPAYTEPSNNLNQNIMASGIYNYPNKEDETYGGYGNTPNNSRGI